jgi:lysophospholipase L1-like esterase
MLKFAALALVIGLSTGCSVVALHPLAGDQAAPVIPSMAGLWRPVGETDTYRISVEDATTLKYCEIKDEKAEDCGSVQLIQLAGQMYADLVPDGSIVPLHLILRVKISADEIRMAMLEKVDLTAVPRYEIVGKGDTQQVVFTASTKELQSAMPRLAARTGAFGEEQVLQRVKSATPAAAPPALPLVKSFGNSPGLTGGFCSDKPFYYSTALPEGNYNVTVTFGDPAGPSSTTLRAESRRLIFEKIETAAGQLETRSFTVNIRNSRINSTESVRLKPREIGKLDWDDKLTLEFNGARPCVAGLEIARADDAITVFLAGDSTVVDQDEEPWAAWGQMLPRFFKPGVAIANYAESGEALKSFIAERRLEKLLTQMKRADYLFIQFTHNDQKQGSAYVDPFGSYKEYLKRFIKETRARGATPVLVTSMHRRTFGSGGAEDGKIQNSLGDYPEAMRQTAREEKVALIDLSAMSKTFYEALGPEESKKAFVIYPAGSFPGQKQELKDNTHFNSYGAYELARCVVEGIRKADLGIAKFLVDTPAFDPAHPDPVDKFRLPLTPSFMATKPDGN